jgi:glycosyltransferase involved in cell wall biosynthesis
MAGGALTVTAQASCVRRARAVKDDRPDISVVVPAFNEQELIGDVAPRFLDSLSRQRRSFELIVVNDGSRDRTGAILDELADRDRRLKVIHFARNYGQTAALMAGFWASRAPVIVALDADGQNDPDEVERLVDKLDEGYDVVSGWRKDRKDTWLRTFVSRVANKIIGGITGVHLHDYGCTLKAYRAHMIRDARLFGEMHRFIPVYASMHGARMTEMVVRHHPRTAGRSKYGYGRIARVALDMVLVRMLQKYRTKPLHFFGKVTQWSWLGSAACYVFAALNAWYSQDAWAAFWGKAPLVGLLLFLLGFFALMLGLVAELAMRASYEHDAGRYWEEARRVNFEPLAHARTRNVEQVGGEPLSALDEVSQG